MFPSTPITKKTDNDIFQIDDDQEHIIISQLASNFLINSNNDTFNNYSRDIIVNNLDRETQNKTNKCDHTGTLYTLKCILLPIHN